MSGAVTAPIDASAIRWGIETADAAKYLGYEVEDTDGVSDYQGWGVHLLRRADEASRTVAQDAIIDGKEDIARIILEQASYEWAVLAWSYGSCSGCDAYEDVPSEKAAEMFAKLIEPCPSEDAARQLFADRKGW